MFRGRQLIQRGNVYHDMVGIYSVRVLVAMATCYWIAGEELKSTFVWLGGFVPD